MTTSKSEKTSVSCPDLGMGVPKPHHLDPPTCHAPCAIMKPLPGSSL